MNGNKTFRSSNRFQQPYYYIVGHLDLSGAVTGGIFYFNKDNNLSYIGQRNYDRFYIVDQNVIVDDVVVYTNPDFSVNETSVYGPVFLIGCSDSTQTETELLLAAPSGYGPKTPPQFSGAPLNFIQLNQGSVNVFGHTGARFPYGLTNFGTPDPRTDLKYLSVTVLSTPPPEYSLVIDNMNNTLVNYIEPFYGDSLFNVNLTNNTLITYIDSVTSIDLVVNNSNNKLSSVVDLVDYLPVNSFFNGTVIDIRDVTNSITYTVNVPLGNYSMVNLASTISDLFASIPSPVSMSWDSLSGRFSFNSSGPIISVSILNAEAKVVYGFTGTELNGVSITATNSPNQQALLTVDSFNDTIVITDFPVTTSYTITVPQRSYLREEYANIVNTLFQNIGSPIQLAVSGFVFYVFTSPFAISVSSLSSGAKVLLGFNGTESPGTSITATYPSSVDLMMPISISSNEAVRIRDVTTATTHVVNVSYGYYTASYYASTVSSLFAAIPSPIGLTWNAGLNRFIFTGGANTISVSLLLSNNALLLGFTGLEPNGISITATNPPTFYVYPNTNNPFTLTVPNGTYTTSSLSTTLQALYFSQNVVMDVSYISSSFTFTKQIVPVAGDTGLFRMINTIPNPTTLDTKIGTLAFGVSANSISTSTAPVFDPSVGTNIYVVLTVPVGIYTADSLSTILQNLFQTNSPTVPMFVVYDSSISRFIFTKAPLGLGDPGNFQFIASYLSFNTSIQALLGTLPFAVSANPQQPSTSPPPVSVPAIGTGINSTVIIPNGTYNEYELSQELTNLYYIQGIPITVFYDMEINRFRFIKSAVVPGDPGLFKYVLTDGFNITTADIVTGLDVNAPPPIVSSNPVIANYAPNTPQMALLDAPRVEQQSLRVLTSSSQLQVTANNNTLITYTEPYSGLSNTITVDNTNNKLDTYIAPYNVLLAIDSSNNKLDTYIDPVYPSSLNITSSNNTLITFIDPVSDPNGNIIIDGTNDRVYFQVYLFNGTFVIEFDFYFTQGSYTATNLATSLTSAIQAQPFGSNYSVTWNTDAPNRFALKALSTSLRVRAIIPSIFGTLGFVNTDPPYNQTEIAPNPPIREILPNSNFYAVITVSPGTYTPSGLATALTNAYTNHSPSVNITVTWDSLNNKFIYTKSPLIPSDPALFQFIATYTSYTTTIDSIVGTMNFGVSANPQETYLVSIPGTGITVSLIIPNNPTASEYTQTSLATAITNAYSAYSPLTIFTVSWNAGLNRFVFTKSPVIAGDPALFRFVNTSTINTRIGNLQTITSANPQTTLSLPIYTAYPGTGITTSITIPSNNTYTPTNIATAINSSYSGISVPISAVWNAGLNRFVFTKSPATVGDPALFRFVSTSTLQAALGNIETVALSNPQQTLSSPFYKPPIKITLLNNILDTYIDPINNILPIDGTNNALDTYIDPLNILTVDSTNFRWELILSLPYFPFADSLTINVPQGTYTESGYATAFSQVCASLGWPSITMSWDTGLSRFIMSSTIAYPAIGTGSGETQPGTLTLTGFTTTGYDYNRVAGNPPVTSVHPSTGITVSLIIPNSPNIYEYSATSLATAITTAYVGYSPSIGITCSWNSGLNRFVFTKSAVLNGDSALFRFVNTSNINTRIGNLPTVTSANPQTTLSAPIFTPNPATGITVSFTIPTSPNYYQYIPTNLANTITTAYANYSPSIDITCVWNSVNERFIFTKSDGGLFRFVSSSTIDSAIGDLPTAVSANPQQTLTAPNYGPWSGTDEYIILTVPNGVYNPNGLAQAITNAFNTYFPAIPSSVFGMTVTWDPINQRFTFYKTPIGSSDSGNFQFLYSYNPITTITQLIGSLPFSISGNLQSTLTSPPSPPSLIIPDGQPIVDKGELNVILKVYPK